VNGAVKDRALQRIWAWVADDNEAGWMTAEDRLEKIRRELVVQRRECGWPF